MTARKRQCGESRFENRLRNARLKDKFSTRVEHLIEVFRIPPLAATKQAMGEFLPLLEDFEKQAEDLHVVAQDVKALTCRATCGQNNAMAAEKGQQARLKRSFLDIDRAAAGKKCSRAQAVNWAVDNLVKAKRLTEIAADEWKELKNSCPSSAAAAYLEVFATSNVETKAIEAALKKEDDAEDKEKAAMRRDGKRMTAVCEETIARLKESQVSSKEGTMVA